MIKLQKTKTTEKITNSKYITVKKSKIHSTGVYAKTNIRKGTKIIEYVGKIVSKKESEKIAHERLKKYKNNKDEEAAVYLFELDEKHDIDGDVPWNTAKYINHSCDPNAETQNINGHIWIIAIKNIKKGEEITYDYGYDLEDFHEHPCWCGSKNCVGYIVGQEHIPKLKKILSKQNKQIKI